MNCKNCGHTLSEHSKFCEECGAKVIHERITLRKQVSEIFTNAFGWDNKYFKTIKSLFLEPEEVLGGFINGTRKKFVHPFTFFTIGAAMALIIFNLSADQYIEINQQMDVNNTGFLEDLNNQAINDQIKKMERDSTRTDPIPTFEELKAEQKEQTISIQKAILKNFNLFAFILLPIYSFMAFLVYWKPYNYGEHLTINAYLQGMLFIFSCFFFLLSLLISPSIYPLSLLLSIIFYTYAYARLYQLDSFRAILKIPKFFAVVILIIIALGIVLFIVGVAIGLLIKTIYG